MPTNLWTGGAAAISWLLYVVPGNVSAGNIFSLTLNGKTITYQTVAGTVADVIAGLATAISTSGVPGEWLDITGTASTSGTYLSLSPSTPGTAVGAITASAAIGSGTTTPTLTVSSTIGTPVNAAFGTASTGGSLSNGTYYYRVSAINAVGETLASTETSKVLSGGTSTQTVVVNWTQVAGATGYRIYGRSTGAELFIAGVTGEATLTYTDLGSIAPSGALPTANTTAQNGQGPFDFNTGPNWSLGRVPQGAVAAPSGLAAAAAAGGSLTAGTYFYEITATNANGETTVSNEASATTSGGNLTIGLTWTATPFAQGYKVYRGTSTGAENKLIGTIASGVTVAFTDNGIAGSTVSPPGGNTAAGDDVVFANSSYDCLYNLGQGYPLYNSLTMDLSFQTGNNGAGTLGLPVINATNGYIEYRPLYLQASPLAATYGNGTGAGGGRWKLDYGSNAVASLVNNTGTPADTGLQALLLKGTNSGNVLTVDKGSVGVAVFYGETANLSGGLNIAFISNVQSDAQVRCGSGVTLAAIVKTGGTLELNSNCTTLTHKNGTTAVKLGTPATVSLKGGEIDWYSTSLPGTACTVLGGATLLFDVDARAKSWGTVVPTFYKGCTVTDSAGILTWHQGNSFIIPDGDIGDCNFNFGPGRGFSVN